MIKTVGVARLSFASVAPFTLGNVDLSITVAAVIDSFYYLTYTVSSRTVGSIVPTLGGFVGTSRTTNATFTETLRMKSRDSLLILSASADFDGALDDVTLQFVTAIDDLTVSLDSRVYVGGEVTFAAFDSVHKLGFFDGTAMDATITTGESQLSPGRKTQLNGFRSEIEGGTVTGQIGYRNTQKESITFDPAQSLDNNNRISKLRHNRYHSFKWNITENFDNATGMDIANRDIRPGSPQ